MVVRVMIRIEKKNNKIIETSVLVNSRYEAEMSQLLIPIKLAQLLDLWPPRNGFEESKFEQLEYP